MCNKIGTYKSHSFKYVSMSFIFCLCLFFFNLSMQRVIIILDSDVLTNSSVLIINSISFNVFIILILSEMTMLLL